MSYSSRTNNLKKIPPIVYLLFLFFGGFVLFRFGPGVLGAFIKSNPPQMTTVCQQIDYSCTNNQTFNFPQGEDPLPQEKEGTKKFLTGDYQKAIELFTTAFQAEKDPSTLISLNNARVLEEVKSGALKPEQVFTLATVIPLESKTPEFISHQLLAGVAQQQEKANNNNNFKILVVMATDGNDQSKGAEIAKKIADNPEIVGVIGHYASRVSLYAIKPYTNKQIPLISATSSSNDLSAKSPFFFRTTPTSKQMAPRLANYLVSDKKINHVVIFYENGKNVAVDNYKKLTEALKQYPTVNVTTYDLNEAQLITQRLEAFKQQSNNNPNNTAIVILPDAYINETSVINPKKVLQQNKGYFTVAGSNTLLNEKYTLLGGAYINNVVVVNPWFPDKEDIDVINNKWGNQFPAHYLPLASDATAVFTQGIKRLTENNQTVTGAAIREVIAAPDFKAKGMTGEISFEGSDRTQDISTLVIADCSNNSCQWRKLY